MRQGILTPALSLEGRGRSKCPLRLKKGVEDTVRNGMPWVYASDIIDSSELMMIPPGSVVSIENQKGQCIGTGYYNSKSQISCRVLTLAREAIDVDFFVTRLEKALALRDNLIGVPYYRLIHSEPDGLPGLLVDRFGDTLVVQVGTAGMELLQPLWMQALEQVLKPHAVLLRNDTASRTLEGLKREVRFISPPLEGGVGGGVLSASDRAGGLPPTLTLPLKGGGNFIAEVLENGCIYLADLVQGQKTGWFYDQRDNRKMIADLAKDKTVVDVYSHSGGFGLIAAKQGAAQVTMVDSSKLALELAAKAAERNGVSERCDYVQGDAFEAMERLFAEGKRFDIVLADPPAFVKSKKDIAAGLKGYEKVARMAAALAKPGGLLFVASCSHHAGRSAFNKSVLDGVKKAGLKAEILKQTGAAPDHPRHPCLPQNEYLKGILLRML